MIYFKSSLTEWGAELLAAAQNGASILFTAIGLGDGHAPADLTTVTTLANERQRLGIDEKHINGADFFASAQIKNYPQPTGYFLREMALYAADPNHMTDRSRDRIYTACATYSDSSDGHDYFVAVPGVNDKMLLATYAEIHSTVATGANINVIIQLPSRELNDAVWQLVSDVENLQNDAVQSATLGGADVTKSGTQLQFPALATDAQGAKADTALQPADMTAHNTSNVAHVDIRVAMMNFLDGLPAYNASTHILTFTRYDGAVLSVDLPLEGLAKGLSYDLTTKEIILIALDGNETRVSIADLVDIYIGSVGSQIQITVDSGNVIRAELLDGSIAIDKLATALQNVINSAVQSATIGGVDVTKSGTQLQLPAYPTRQDLFGNAESALPGNRYAAIFNDSWAVGGYKPLTDFAMKTDIDTYVFRVNGV